MKAWITVYWPFVLGAAVFGGWGLVCWLQRRPERPDKMWKPTGYRYSHEGFDQSKAVESARRASDLEERSRALHNKRALGDKARLAKVTNIREVAK